MSVYAVSPMTGDVPLKLTGRVAVVYSPVSEYADKFKYEHLTGIAVGYIVIVLVKSVVEK